MCLFRLSRGPELIRGVWYRHRDTQASGTAVKLVRLALLRAILKFRWCSRYAHPSQPHHRRPLERAGLPCRNALGACLANLPGFYLAIWLMRLPFLASILFS
jgi:hypothetical protein